MMRRLSLILASASLYLLAALGPGPERRTIAPILMDLTRPLVLPTLWASLEESRQSGRHGEYAAKGRLLMRYLPGWVDGTLYFAWLLANPPPGSHETPGESLSRLLAALQWLDQAVAELTRQDPSGAAEILLTQAFFVEVRTVHDERLAAAVMQAFGRDPATVAADYIDRAIALAPSQVKVDRRIMLYPRLISAALRMRDLQRARMLTDTALDQLTEVADRDLAIAWSNSLRSFRAFLDGVPDMKLEDLAQDPYLVDLVEAYRMGQN